MMKKNILTVLLVAMLMASLAAAANALTMADYTSGLTDADYGELFRCKKTTTSGMYGTTTTEHYLLKENCAGQVDYSTDSSKEELGYAFKKKANQNLNLAPLLACEKPEGGGITDVTTSACQSGYNAQNLGYAFKAQGDAPAGLKVKPLYKCLGEPGLVKPREVACGSSGGSIIAWVLADKPQTTAPTSTYGSLIRCKKATSSGPYGTKAIEHYLLKENCQGQIGYNADSSVGELGFVITSKKHAKLVQLFACEKPEGDGIEDITTSACYSSYSNLNARSLGYVFKVQGDAPQGFKVKPLYKCLGEPGLVKPREVACGSSGGSIIAWTAENQNQQLPTETTTAVQPPAAQPPAGFDAESCVDDMYTSVLPVMQPDTWNKRTPVAGLSSASEIKQRIVDAEAMIQYLLCRNKCLRTKLGDAFINSNCKPKGSTLPATLVKPPILAGSKVTGKIVAFFKGL